MNHKVFKTTGVCSRSIEFDYEDGMVYNLKFTGGCAGNLTAIAKLVEGKPMSELITILEGNTCGPRPTSCADQLTIAFKEVL